VSIFVYWPLRRAESAEAPDILGVVVAQDIVIAAVDYNAEKCGAGRIPPVFDRYHLKRTGAKMHAHGAIIALVPGVTFDAYHLLTHGLAQACGCPLARRSTLRQEK